MSDNKVTNEMIHAAVKQGVKDNILPKYTYDELYIHHYESVERMIKAALEAGGDNE
jgi:hypothetical protein